MKIGVLRDFSTLIKVGWIGTTLVDDMLLYLKFAWKFLKEFLITFDIKQQTSLIQSPFRDISLLNKFPAILSIRRGFIQCSLHLRSSRLSSTDHQQLCYILRGILSSGTVESRL